MEVILYLPCGIHPVKAADVGRFRRSLACAAITEIWALCSTAVADRPWCPGENIGEPCLLIDVAQSGGSDQGADHDGVLPAAILAAKQPCLATGQNAAQRTFGRTVRQADAPIIDELGERVPALED